LAKRAQFGQLVISRHDLSASEIQLLGARISLLETLRGLNIAWVDLVLSRGENPIEALSVKE
jgi:outer membrane protein TolC